jgi:YidC/Oxa1 family membrane protein insertase
MAPAAFISPLRPFAERPFLMLDFVYYPVSAVLWAWHNVLAAALGPSSALSWVLAVVLLVITLRSALIVPFLKQARFQQVMQRLQPQVAAIKKRYPSDRRRQSVEIQKLQQEHGVNLLLGCLPVLAQVLVFIGLFHVLRSFDRTGATMHLPFVDAAAPMSAEQNAHTANYVFNAEQVQSFLNARLFGAALAASIHTAGAHIGAVTAVTIPLMIVAAIATHFTARASATRQPSSPNNATMLRVLSLWIFPAGALVSGPLLPVAILIYWVTTNAWTLAQQHFVYQMLDREAAQAAQRTRQRRAALAPRPGRKPSGREEADPARGHR